MAPEVVVVGAGPAGAALAGLLAGQGVAVALLDRARFPREKACGECLNPGAVAMLRRLGLWPAVAPLEPSVLRGWRLTAGRRRVDLDFPAPHHAVALDRRRLDHALVNWAVGQGARLLEGVRACDLTRDHAGRITGVRTVAHGTISGRIVVGADGLRSVVQRRLGLHAAGPSPPKVAFTAHWSGVDGLTDRGEIHFRGNAVCGIAPAGPGEANVVLVVPAQAARRLDPICTLQQWSRLRGAAPGGAPLATGPFDQPVRAVTAPGALLVGDAAGYYDPLTGQGIYRALRSAELAAPAIRQALEGREEEAFRAYRWRLAASAAPGVRRQRWLDHLVRRPRLLGAGLATLSLCPPAGRHLLALLGDCHLP